MPLPLLREWMVNISEKQTTGIWSEMVCRKRLIEDLDYAALGERYVKPTGRDLPAMKIERIVYAEKLEQHPF